MPIDVPNRRIGNRLPSPRFLGAVVELPAVAGAPLRLPLVDISLYDLCFAVPVGLPPIARGTSFAGATVRAGHFAIHCNLTVTRTWRQSDSITHCGARLYPVSDTDQNELVSFAAALEAGPKGSPGG